MQSMVSHICVKNSMNCEKNFYSILKLEKQDLFVILI